MPYAGQCCPIAKEACWPQVLPQGPGSLPSSLHGDYGGFKKRTSVPTGLPGIPWTLEDLRIMVQLHFHRLLLLAPCHHWPDYSQPLEQCQVNCKVILRTVMKLGMVLHQGAHWSFCQEHTQSRETASTGHRAWWCGGAPQQHPRHGCRQCHAAPGDHPHPPIEPSAVWVELRATPPELVQWREVLGACGGGRTKVQSSWGSWGMRVPSELLRVDVD